jgi:cytochrome c5
MAKSPRLIVVMAVGAALILGSGYDMAASQARRPHQPTKVVWAGVYTPAQAARGKLAYTQYCSRCHREDLSGGQTVMPLNGAAFFDRWHQLTLFDLFAMIQSGMPHDHVVFIPKEAARDVVGFLLYENGIPAGDKELSSDIEELADILITRTPPAPK